MQTSADVDKISAAIVVAQGELRAVEKDARNPHLGNKYADIVSVVSAIRATLHKHGLAYVQDTESTDRGLTVRTRILHTSGQWIETGPLSVPVVEQKGVTLAQVTGSAVTYLRRYSLMAAFGVVAGDEDDDGEGSRPVDERKAPAPPQPADRRAKAIEWIAAQGVALADVERDLERPSAEWGADEIARVAGVVRSLKGGAA